MVGRELASRFFEDRTRPRTTIRPSVRIRAFTNVLLHVVRMRTRQVPHRQASTSRDVSDQAFPRLSNFYCVLRCACGGRPGNEATIQVHVHVCIQHRLYSHWVALLLQQIVPSKTHGIMILCRTVATEVFVVLSDAMQIIIASNTYHVCERKEDDIYNYYV